MREIDRNTGCVRLKKSDELSIGAKQFLRGKKRKRVERETELKKDRVKIKERRKK